MTPLFSARHSSLQQNSPVQERGFGFSQYVGHESSRSQTPPSSVLDL